MANLTPSGINKNKGPRPAQSPTTPPPVSSAEDATKTEHSIIVQTPMPVVEDLGDLTDLGMMESVTVSALVEAAIGDGSDDDALDFNAVGDPSAGPLSGFMRPSAAPDDDALSLDIIPSAPGADAPLSFVARSDIQKVSPEAADVIAKPTLNPASKGTSWYTGPKSGKIAPVNSPKSGKLPTVKPVNPASITGASSDVLNISETGESVAGRSDIFGENSITRGGDSNLFEKQGEKNLLADLASNPNALSSDLFGDSRVVPSHDDVSRASSDILAHSRHSSDILASSNAKSDILSGQSVARGSSLFDDSGKKTDTNLESRGEPSIASPDQFVPLFNEDVDGSAIITNNPLAKGMKTSPDLIDDDPGRISFDIPRRKKKNADTNDRTAEMSDAIEDDGDVTGNYPVAEDDDAMVAEFHSGGERSGINLLGAYDHQDTMSEGEEDESSDLFSGATIMDMDMDAASGVNLLDPKSGASSLAKRSGLVPSNPKSEVSIFGPEDAGRDVARSNGSAAQSKSKSQLPSALFKNVPVPPGGPSSAIFSPVEKPKSSAEPEHVSFELPKRSSKSDQAAHSQTSGIIDWSKSTGSSDSDQLSQRMQKTDELNLSGNLFVNEDQKTEAVESDSVFDVQIAGDSSTESQLHKVEAYAKAVAAGQAVAESGIIAGRSGKLPKLEPASSRTKFVPPPPVKKTGMTWIGGTAVGLLAGVGISSGAYLAGLIPGKSDTSAELTALTQKHDADLATAIENTKRDIEDRHRISTAEIDKELREVKSTVVDLKDRAMTADRTAKAANEAKMAAESLAKNAVMDAEKANMKAELAAKEAANTLAIREELEGKIKQAQMAIRTKTDEATLATEKLAAAESNAKLAKSALAAAAKELQKAGFLDAKLEGDQALASITSAIKKAALTGKPTDNARLDELANKLISAEKDAETARKQAATVKTKADQDLAALRKEKETLIANYETKLKAASTGSPEATQAAVATAVKAYQAKLDSKDADLKRVQDDLTREVARYEQRLTTQAEEFRQQITALRSGIMVATTDAERMAADRANRLFGLGSDAYFDGRYTDAVAALEDATKANPADARVWYYLGLSRWATGDRKAAIEAFKAGGQWESRSVNSSKIVGSALERVQGPARQALDAYRP
ncbi:MAG: tetratricopeptide repeat protein [Gemmataceae bacterium]